MLNSAEHGICPAYKLLTNANSFLQSKAEHEKFSINRYENAYCYYRKLENFIEIELK